MHISYGRKHEEVFYYVFLYGEITWLTHVEVRLLTNKMKNFVFGEWNFFLIRRMWFIFSFTVFIGVRWTLDSFSPLFSDFPSFDKIFHFLSPRKNKLKWRREEILQMHKWLVSHKGEEALTVYKHFIMKPLVKLARGKLPICTTENRKKKFTWNAP